MGRGWRAVALVVILAAAWALPARAQVPNPGDPTDVLNNPHPGMPWDPSTHLAPRPSGRVIRSWVVPDRILALEVLVPQPGSLSPVWERVLVRIPGYVVVETMTGFLHPGRWTVAQVAQGGYQWVWMPPKFQAKR